MTTYAENRGETFIDWNSVLDVWGSMDTLQRKKYVKLSTKWVTCACGNQCASISRGARGIPSDKLLQALGLNFFEKLRDDEIGMAKNILRDIDARSAELISRLN